MSKSIRRVVALAVLAVAGCASSGHVPPPPSEQLPRPTYSERPEGAPAREGVDARRSLRFLHRLFA